MLRFKIDQRQFLCIYSTRYLDELLITFLAICQPNFEEPKTDPKIEQGQFDGSYLVVTFIKAEITIFYGQKTFIQPTNLKVGQYTIFILLVKRKNEGRVIGMPA
jgi:hypothetical protein